MRKAMKWTALAVEVLRRRAFSVLTYLARIPKDTYGIVRALPQMRTGELQVGDAAPDAELVALDGAARFRLHERLGPRPLVLVFGSYTWPPFRRQVGDLVQMNERFHDHADFLTVYIREAHPDDEWQVQPNLDEEVCYLQPKNEGQRVAIANDFAKRFKYPLPLAVDDMNNGAERAYAAWPERLYIIEGGRIVYKGGNGPFNYKPAEVRAWLEARFAGPATTR